MPDLQWPMSKYFKQEILDHEGIDEVNLIGVLLHLAERCSFQPDFEMLSIYVPTMEFPKQVKTIHDLRIPRYDLLWKFFSTENNHTPVRTADGRSIVELRYVTAVTTKFDNGRRTREDRDELIAFKFTEEGIEFLLEIKAESDAENEAVLRNKRREASKARWQSYFDSYGKIAPKVYYTFGIIASLYGAIYFLKKLVS